MSEIIVPGMPSTANMVGEDSMVTEEELDGKMTHLIYFGWALMTRNILQLEGEHSV